MEAIPIAQGSELKWGKAWSQPEARDQALTVSLGTVPPDSTSSGFPGRSHGDPGEASGAWGHCGLPGSGEQEIPTGWEVRGGPHQWTPSPCRPVPTWETNRLPLGPGPTSSGLYGLGPSFINVAWT